MNDSRNDGSSDVSDNSKVHYSKHWPQWLAAISACIGMFCGGICFGWSSPSIRILMSPSSPINITSSEASWITSLLQFGAAFGPIPGAIICKYFGLKTCILLSAIPYLISFVLICFANTVMYLYISRFLAGIAVGLSYASTPIYISEISASHNRGSLMILFTLSNNLGVVFETIVAPYVTIEYMAIIMSVFPILLLVTFSFAPESPLYYARIKQETKALHSLSLLRRQNDLQLLSKEWISMKMNTQDHMKFFDCFKEFHTPRNIKAFGIVAMAVMCQQFSGSVTALLYLETLYSSMRIDVASNIAVVMTLLIVNVVSLLTMSLSDRWGRRPVLMMSACGCILSDAMLGVYFLWSRSDIPNITILAIVALNTLEISAVIGLTPIPYTIAGEIFSANAKEIALCVISVCGALSGFLASKLFQVVEDSFGTHTVFFGLSIVTFLLAFKLYLFLPETKGKSFNEIQEILKTPSFHFSQRPLTTSMEYVYDPNVFTKF